MIRDCNQAQLLGHHHLHKLLVIDLSITINICLTNHLINFFISQLLTQVGHHMTQLCCSGVLAEGTHDSSQLFGGDSSVTILVEEREGFLEFCNLFLSELIGHGEEKNWRVSGRT